ncbi:type I-B CRISPR-associated protein Cas8b1/Cst1 [Methanobacterium petrolearium]|uniref:type I-B CRISPR-associated protein Cas8b1/Cst1 n=1 Tax=Methanobacterium petrolearium TaxID=710190 RepID=UPI001AE0EBAD|nr:type I-B CRISPR-associated protein Cas8b1/Cst1 [Methanobacterium petrolearium]MBP1946365.1 CRISPR-associated protein Cst1 [Methanobacterium petrolearium]BDZ70615.1 type I-B CRISPR-associated protein Cas8b1/Cst1 [Methanobacterium petrolearium]
MNEIFYDFTGNPFVDAGIWAISQWVGKKPEKLDKDDFRSIINDVTFLYLSPKWSKNMYQIFPNNPITNNAVKDKKNRYSQILNELIEEMTPLGNNGNCISCGRRDVLERSAKDRVPLTGSKKLINYFSFGTDGADYCPACTFAIQFAPLIMYSCVKMLLIHSNSRKVMKKWSKKAKNNIDKQLSSKNYTGCLNEGFKNPKNALFHIIQDMILSYDERWYLEKPSINFYHFTNFNQGPNLDIYNVPTSVFRFLAYIPPDNFENWLKVVRRGYRFVNWEKVKEEDEYKNNPNTVYDNLLENKSIIRFFINRKNREAIGGWDLISYYLEEVRNMDEKRINVIKDVGDRLVDHIETMDDMKTLNRLEMAANYRSFRNVLRIIIKKRISNGIEDPLFTFDDYVDYLFPEGNLTWRETQDLILFRIYEKLQPWIIQQGNQSELETQESEEAQEEE